MRSDDDHRRTGPFEVCVADRRAERPEQRPIRCPGYEVLQEPPGCSSTRLAERCRPAGQHDRFGAGRVRRIGIRADGDFDGAERPAEKRPPRHLSLALRRCRLTIGGECRSPYECAGFEIDGYPVGTRNEHETPEHCARTVCPEPSWYEMPSRPNSN